MKCDVVEKWWRLFAIRRDHEKCLQDLKAWERNKRKIKVFDGISRPAPYVLISGTKKKAVKVLHEEVVRVSMR